MTYPPATGGPRRPPSFRRRLSRRRRYLVLAACILDIHSEDELKHLRGRLVGSKNIRRTRKSVESMWKELGCYARTAYRMSIESFHKLHSTLRSDLCREFKVGKRTRGGDPNGEITTKLRLSAAIRFFSGASIYDIMLTHGMGKQTVYNSVYGVANAINSCEDLSFNEDGAPFPSHAEQAEIAAGFFDKSAAGFDKIIMALDGMLVWTSQPSRTDCEYLKMGERSFHCFRKDKFGMLLLAGCDHRTKFRWADLTHPGFTGDYLAWTTSDVGRELTEGGSDLVARGHTIAGGEFY